MKISIVLGTRPEIIKFSPIIRKCEQLGLDYFILHTGQHYSYNMDKVFFEQLALPEVAYNLDIGAGSQAEQTGKIMIAVEGILQKEMPDVVLVEGDTNTVLGGVIAAVKLRIKVGHVEAGLRSYDRRMPEETNRVIADHCSDLLFAPTEKSKQILLHEGIRTNKIFVVGNTIVDVAKQNLELAKLRINILDELGIKKRDYFVATAHRQENVDDAKRFSGIIEGLERVHREFGLPIVYPIHPRAKKNLKEFGLESKNLKLVEPLDYFAFLQLESEAKMVFTDSGGVQEETCVLGVPCVTLRDNTERPETLEVGSNILTGTHPDRIVEGAKTMLNRENGWENPFGDGTTGVKIVELLRCEFE